MSALIAGRTRVLHVGEGPTALSALRSLSARFAVIGVVRNPPDRVTDPVCQLADTLGSPVFAKRSAKEIGEVVDELRPDIVVISSNDKELGADILGRCRFVNVHYSPLPRYRGRANVNWAIINGEPSAWVSVHLVAPGLDAGNVLYQGRTPISVTDTADAVYDRLNDIQERALGEAVERYLAGDMGQPQDQSGATYTCTRNPEDGEVNWGATTEETDRLIRGLPPAFPAFTYLDGQPLEILRAVIPPDAPVFEGRISGRIAGRSLKEGWVDVLTGDGILRLVEVVRRGESPVAPATLIRSVRVTLGLSKQDLLRRIEALERIVGK